MTIVRNEIGSVTAKELNVDSARDAFAQVCRRELDVSPEEFLEHYDADTIPSEWSARAVQRVEFALPFLRR